MKEKAPEIIYKAYVDYGIVVIVAVAGVLAVWILLKYIRALHEKHIVEKDKQIEDLRAQLQHCREEMRRMTEVFDHANDVISENSKALYENASVVKHVEGVLVGLSERLKR